MSLVRNIFHRLLPVLRHTYDSRTRGFATTTTKLIKPFMVQDYSSIRKYEDSFQHWILTMFATQPNYTVIEYNAKNIETVHNEDFKTLDVEALLQTLCVKKHTEALTPLTLRKIDDALSARITHKTSVEHLLSCLHVYMTNVPIHAPKLKSYNNALLQLENRIKKSLLNVHQLVQAIYYASHLKQGLATKNFMPAAVYHLDVDALKELNNADLGIICVSLFRSSVPCEKPALLNFLVERFKQEIDTMITEEPAIFVSFVKCFRISNYYDDTMMNFIASKGQNSLSQLDIVARIHLGVYFSASQFGNIEFMNNYLSSCIDDISKNIVDGKEPRLKDIDNLLWSCSVYNTEKLCNSLQLSKVTEYIKSSLFSIKSDWNAQIAILLWLWICGCRCEQEVFRCLTPQRVNYIAESKNFKSVANLFLLLTCVDLESPGLLKPNVIGVRDKRLQPRFERYLNKRRSLKVLLTTIQKNSSSLMLENVRFDFPVPTLYIGSICADYKGKPLSIEVIDSSVCLMNSNHLKGRLILKLRLLQKMKIPYLLIPSCTSYDIDNIQELLQEHSASHHDEQKDH